MPMQQPQAPMQQAPQGQAPQQSEGQGKISELVNSTGQGLQLLIKVFGTAGVPKEAIGLLNQSMESFTQALQVASGSGEGGPSSEGGASTQEAAGSPAARPVNPAM
jgi:hypothetical protein